MYDVMVIGARCAGSPTAMLLARRGHKVLLVDRATFPSDTMSTHFVQIPGVARLRRWGLLDEVAATGCPPITKGRLNIGGEEVGAEFPFPDGIPGLFAPRRTVLDKILVDAAVDAGAELRDGVFIDSLSFDDGRVVGAEGHTSEGSFFAGAKVVIGADGRNSVVAKAVGAEYREYTPPLGCGYYAYFSGVECDEAELYLHDETFSAVFPTNDGLTTVAIGFPRERFKDIRTDPLKHLLDAADRLGSLGGRLRAGKVEGKMIGMADLANYIRTSHGSGWALVGDAAYQKDPTPADGITDAFRGAELLADALDRALCGEASEDEALRSYQESLEKASKPLLDLTVTMSSFDNSPADRANAFFELGGVHERELHEVLSTGEAAVA